MGAETNMSAFPDAHETHAKAFNENDAIRSARQKLVATMNDPDEFKKNWDSAKNAYVIHTYQYLREHELSILKAQLVKANWHVEVTSTADQRQGDFTTWVLKPV